MSDIEVADLNPNEVIAAMAKARGVLSRAVRSHPRYVRHGELDQSLGGSLPDVIDVARAAVTLDKTVERYRAALMEIAERVHVYGAGDFERAQGIACEALGLVEPWGTGR